MRVLGLDVGTRTIGVAVSDALGMIANGVETIHRTSKERDYARIQQLVRTEGVQLIVVGYPKNMNGTVGERANACAALAEDLRQLLAGVRVELWDERLSTVAAQRTLIEADLSRKKRKAVIDKMAAVVILQNFLDSVVFGRICHEGC